MRKEPTDVMIGAYLTLDPAKADYEAVTRYPEVIDTDAVPCDAVAPFPARLRRPLG